MRIGIDLQCLPIRARELTGISNYAYLLSKYLLKLGTPHKFVFFLAKGSPFKGELVSGGGEVVELPAKRILLYSAHIAYAKAMTLARLDVLHGPANTLPLFYRGRSILTIHDLAIYKHPEWFPGRQWFSTRLVVPQSIEIAGKIIVPSEATKRDLIELFHVSSFKISVIPHGVEERFFQKLETGVGRRELGDKLSVTNSKFQTSNSYILFVGTIEPRKNVVRLIEAYSKLPEDITNQYNLVIAGQRGLGFEDVFLEISNLKLEIKSRVKLLNYVPEEKLPILYKRASLFVYPSLYEGFGLPVLEAMASGVPVVTSNISSMPEVVGEAGLLVNPYSVAEITDAIMEIVRDNAKASQISIAGMRRAAKFNWEDAAKRMLAVYLA